MYYQIKAEMSYKTQKPVMFLFSKKYKKNR